MYCTKTNTNNYDNNYDKNNAFYVDIKQHFKGRCVDCDNIPNQKR